MSRTEVGSRHQKINNEGRTIEIEIIISTSILDLLHTAAIERYAVVAMLFYSLKHVRMDMEVGKYGNVSSGV